jgi:hypothetical protein
MTSPAHFLGVREDHSAEGHCFVYDNTPVYTKPDSKNKTWATLRRGIQTEVERDEGEFVQISYKEFQRQPPPGFNFLPDHGLGSPIGAHLAAATFVLPI